LVKNISGIGADTIEAGSRIQLSHLVENFILNTCKDRKAGHFYRATFRTYFNKVLVKDISGIDGYTWVSPGLGDPWDGPPPAHLTTKVKTLYEQRVVEHTA
jgi:hypothetical protein